MKRIISALLVFVTLVALCACEDEIISATTTTHQATTQGATTGTTGAIETTATVSPTELTEGTTTTTVTTTMGTTVSTSAFTTITQTNLHSPLDSGIFDDAIFVGDSVTNNLRLYLGRQNNSGRYPIGRGKVLCAASLSYTNSLWAIDRPGNVHPSYNGKKCRVPDGVAESGAKKVFIMLGMNDFIIYGADLTVRNANTLINQIVAKCPDVTIYVQSVTPILKANEQGAKNNANVRRVNDGLRRMCEENGWIYLDVASALVDEYGNLDSAYCIDPGVNGMGIHINDYACQKWLDYLRANIPLDTPPEPTTTTTAPATTTVTEVTTTTQTPTTTTQIGQDETE